MTRPPTSRPAPSSHRRRGALVGAVAVAAALVALAAVGAAPERPVATAGSTVSESASPAVSPGGMHAEVACDFAGKAEEASSAPELAERARYAVAVLLLDQAIIESARAAELDPALGILDTALRAAHAAGHQSDHGEWQRALGTARAECRSVASGGA